MHDGLNLCKCKNGSLISCKVVAQSEGKSLITSILIGVKAEMILR